MADRDGAVPQGAGSQPLLSYVITHVGSAAIVVVTGELDLHTVRELAAVAEQAASGSAVELVVLDLTAVGFVGSSGFGGLIVLRRRLAEVGAALRLVAGDNRAVLRPWTVMALQDAFPLFPDLPSALAHSGRIREHPAGPA